MGVTQRRETNGSHRDESDDGGSDRWQQHDCCCWSSSSSSSSSLLAWLSSGNRFLKKGLKAAEAGQASFPRWFPRSACLAKASLVLSSLIRCLSACSSGDDACTLQLVLVQLRSATHPPPPIGVNPIPIWAGWSSPSCNPPVSPRLAPSSHRPTTPAASFVHSVANGRPIGPDWSRMERDRRGGGRSSSDRVVLPVLV